MCIRQILNEPLSIKWNKLFIVWHPPPSGTCGTAPAALNKYDTFKHHYLLSINMKTTPTNCNTDAFTAYNECRQRRYFRMYGCDAGDCIIMILGHKSVGGHCAFPKVVVSRCCIYLALYDSSRRVSSHAHLPQKLQHLLYMFNTAGAVSEVLLIGRPTQFYPEYTLIRSVKCSWIGF